MALDPDKLYDLCWWTSKRRACETLVASIRREVVPEDVAEERVREFIEADMRYTELYAELYKDIVEQDPAGRPRIVKPRTEFAFKAMSTGRVGQGRWKNLDEIAVEMHAGDATGQPPRGTPVAIEIEGDIQEPRELDGDERELLKHKLAMLSHEDEAAHEAGGRSDVYGGT